MGDSQRQHRSFFNRLFRSDAASAEKESLHRRPLLTANDQLAIAVVASLALVVMTASWLASGGLGGGWVDIDEAEPLQASFQTDINSANWTELMQLPEVGETLAKRIVESREAKGPFKSGDDLRRVYGIGPKTLEKLRPYLKPVE